MEKEKYIIIIQIILVNIEITIIFEKICFIILVWRLFDPITEIANKIKSTAQPLDSNFVGKLSSSSSS